MLTADGWKDAYGQFVAGGWAALSCPPEFGGQNLPRALSALIEEMWNGANVAFALCPMLTRGTIDAIELQRSAALKATYLAEAGERGVDRHHESDRAPGGLGPRGGAHARRAHGRWPLPARRARRSSSRMANTISPRTSFTWCWRASPERPEGVKGISLFVVPKFLVNDDGSLGRAQRCALRVHRAQARNPREPDLRARLGQDGGAIGELVGEENRGLEYMFIMMNAARFSVGMEGIGCRERAYQAALAYARERIQGTEPRRRAAAPAYPSSAIPTCGACCCSMKSQTEAMRALAAVAAVSLDAARCIPTPRSAQRHQALRRSDDSRGERLVHREFGRDRLARHPGARRRRIRRGDRRGAVSARCAHHADLRGHHRHPGQRSVGRKLARDGGPGGAERHRGDARDAAPSDRRIASSRIWRRSHRRCAAAVDALEAAVLYVVPTYPKDIRAARGRRAAAQALRHRRRRLAAAALGVDLRQRLAEGATTAAMRAFYAAKIATARFYADHVLSQAPGLAHSVVHGAAGALADGVL